MKTMKQWNELLVDFDEFVNAGDEIDEEMYEYFLGVAPPADMGYNFFLMGEPIDTNSEGELLFSKFSRKDNKHYYDGLTTMEALYGN